MGIEAIFLLTSSEGRFFHSFKTLTGDLKKIKKYAQPPAPTGYKVPIVDEQSPIKNQRSYPYGRQSIDSGPWPQTLIN